MRSGKRRSFITGSGNGFLYGVICVLIVIVVRWAVPLWKTLFRNKVVVICIFIVVLKVGRTGTTPLLPGVQGGFHKLARQLLETLE